MNSPEPKTCPALKDGFAWYEKVLVRAALVGMVLVAATAIYSASPTAAVAYLLFGLVGGLLVIYDFLCVYCPYPYEYGDCLFFPAPLLTAVVKRRSGSVHGLRKALLLLTVAGLILIPQYWLWGRWALFAGFWGLAAAIGLAFPFYYCRRCRHGGCAFNRAASAGPEGGGDPSE